jgi:hypothetical protein
MPMARDRDRIATALAATEAQRKSREALVGQRKRDASTIADLRHLPNSHLVRSIF